MVSILIAAVVILAASVLVGAAILRLLGRPGPTPLAGAIGFAALTIACPILIRLPGRATTSAVVVGVALAVSGWRLWGQTPVRGASKPRGGEGQTPGGGSRGNQGESPPPGRQDRVSGAAVAAITALVVLALACLPFLFNDSTGILGEGVYTNDHSAQLYWTDWLQHGFGPEPSAVRFGYPTGPQSVTATVSQATGIDLEPAFNGLLIAIPVLTALAALAYLANLPPGRRVVAATLTGLPYLAVSFLAQSAFKETVMALLVLAFAVGLSQLARGAPRRATIAALVLFALASLFTYSVPGLVWFAGALVAWLVLEVLFGALTIDLAAARDALRRHRRPAIVAAVVIVVVGAVAAAQVGSFTGKIGDVQQSSGRLASPVFPGEAFGIWPEGDFRVVRGDVSGAIPAVLFGLLGVGLGALAAARRRDFALPSMLATGAVVYVGARLFASIYVEAKALAVIAPTVMLAALAALLAPSNGARHQVPGTAVARRPGTASSLRFVLGAAFAAAAGVSTFLALRAAPVGFDQRGDELASLAARVAPHRVVFLGVDRTANYRLAGTLAASPGGYTPVDVRARKQKIWQQGLPLDFDTLDPAKLDAFPYAITTSAAYASTPPSSFRKIATAGDYVLWKRTGKTSRTRVLNEDGAPGVTLDCKSPRGAQLAGESGTATVLPTPVVGPANGWSTTSPFDAPASATQELQLGPGTWDLSLQYHSQVSLTVGGSAHAAVLPPNLDGMYITDDLIPNHPQDAFWPAGRIEVSPGSAPTRITVTAAGPNGLQNALGVPRRVWLGEIAATPVAAPRTVPLAHACGKYVDHYLPTA